MHHEQPHATRPAPPDLIIDARGVECAFAPGVGVFDLTLQLPAASILGLIGPSGSGKTTTVRLLAGLRKPNRGSIRVLGQVPHLFDVAARERIGYMSQHFVLYPHLTVWENMHFVASLYGLPYAGRTARFNDLLAFVELTEARTRRSSQLSGGMQRRLELAAALVHQPDLLFADEPTAGIDPILRRRFWEHFRTLRGQGRTLLVTTQYIGEAAYCDLVGIMSQGRLLYLDTPDTLRRLALNGEVVRIAVSPDEAAAALDLLREPPARLVRPGPPHEPGVLYVHVDDAGAAIPLLVQRLSQHPTVRLLQVEAYTPPFDQIFVTLLERA